MKVISIQIGKPRIVEWRGRQVSTSIFKSPVAGPVRVAQLNLVGDGQADLSVHGGTEKAIYVYSSEHYDFWRAELPETELAPGAFGENLTISDLPDEGEIYIGSQYRIGDALFRVSQPRMPCFKLGIRFGDDRMVKRFMDARRMGFYFSVVREGEIQAGDTMILEQEDHAKISVTDITRMYLREITDSSRLQAAIELESLPRSWRDFFAERMN